MSLTESPGSPWFKESKSKANDPANDLPSKPRKTMLFDLIALDDPSKTFEQDREDILLSNGFRNQREILALDTLRNMNDGDSSPIPGSGFILDKMKSTFVKANTTRALKEINPKTTTSLPRGSESAKNKPKTALKLPALGQFPDPASIEKATPKANVIVPPKRIYTQNERTRSKEIKETQVQNKYSKGSFVSPKQIMIGEELYNPDKVFTPSSEDKLSDIKTPTLPKSIKLLNDIRESSPNEEADTTAQQKVPMIRDLIEKKRMSNPDEFAMRLQLPRPKRMSRTMNEIPEQNYYRSSKAENENNSLPKIEDSPTDNPVSRQKERRKSREKSTERPKRNFIMELLQEYANDNRVQSPEMFQSLLRLESEFKEIREEKPDSPKKYNRKKKRIGLRVFSTKNQEQTPLGNDQKESPKNTNEEKLGLEVRAIKPKLKIKVETQNNFNVKPSSEKTQTGFYTTRNTPAHANGSHHERIYQQNLLAKAQRRIAMHGFNVFKFNLALQNSPKNQDLMGSAPSSARNSIENATNRHMAHIRHNSMTYKEKKTLRPPLLYTSSVLKEREKENRASGTTGVPLNGVDLPNPVIGIKKLFPLPPSYMDIPNNEPRGITTSRGKAKNEESSGEEKNYSRRTNSMLYASDFINENEAGGKSAKLNEIKNIEQRPKSFYIPKIGSRVAAN